MRRSHRAPAVVTASRCSLTPLPNERLSLDHVLCYRAAASRIHRQQNVSSVPPPAASSLLCHPRTTCFATMHPRTTCPATMSHTYHAPRAPTMSHTYHVPRNYVTHVPRVSLLCHPCATCLTTMSPMRHVPGYYVTHVPRAPLLCHPCATCLATMSPMCHVSRYYVTHVPRVSLLCAPSDRVLGASPASISG